MAPITNARHIFKEVPTGYPIPGKTTANDTSETIDLEATPLNGGVLFKTQVLSVDPYMRGKLREAHVKSYSPAYLIGKPLNNYGVSKVIRSENPKYKTGEYVYGNFLFQEYNIVADPEKEGFTVLKNEEKLPWSQYVGGAGMPGQTAFCGWHEFSLAKKGDVVFVTAGSGPVGSTVIQLAKLQGLKVISSAGSADKVAFLKKIGADVAFNYKTDNTLEVLEKEGPVDIYWDNVGGSSLEAALATANTHARFIVCGSISDYNDKPYHVKNLSKIFEKEIKLSGFLVFSLLSKYKEEFYSTIPALIAEGKIQLLEYRVNGLENVGQAILDNQKGVNVGKTVVIVAED